MENNRLPYNPLSAAVAHHARQLARAARRRRTWPFRQPRPARITSKTIVLIDEAGMIGTRHMRMIAEHIAKNGGTLCLVGDPAQLPAIETTSPLQALARKHGAASLTEIRRQNEPWAREAAKTFARGEPGRALAMFAAHNAVTVRDSVEDAVRQACLDWTEEGLLTPQRAIILANTNELVETANSLCQEHRLRAGCLHPSAPIRITDEQDDTCYESRVYIGDRVLFTKNSRRDGVENGSLGTVTAIRHFPPSIQVVLDDQRQVTINVKSFPHVRLGYAATTHKAQGASIPKVFVVAGGNLQNLPASYVQATRAIEDTSFYTTKELLNPWLQGVKESPLAEQMSRKPDLRLASEFLPQAPVELRPRKARLRRVVVRPSSRPVTTPAAEQPATWIPLFSSPAASTPPGEDAQRPADRRPHPPAAQPSPAAFDGTYQRLRLPGGTFRIGNGSMLVASCVDGGLPEYRHRPPPPRQHPMPYAADSIVVQRVEPTTTRVMSLEEAQDAGMLSLVGTGCQDHVLAVCPPNEVWTLTVRDAMGLISPQDDIAAGIALYDRPGIPQALESLDRLDNRLREFFIGHSLLRSLFVCLRREVAWLMPHHEDPCSITRGFVDAFCRMLFEDTQSRYVMQTLSRFLQPLERQYTNEILKSAIPPGIPYPSDQSLNELNLALHENRPELDYMVACVHSIFGELTPSNAEANIMALGQALDRATGVIKSILATKFQSTDGQQEVMELLYSAAEMDVPHSARFMDVFAQFIPLDRDSTQQFPAARYLWSYATHYLRGEEAEAAQVYQSIVQQCGNQNG